MLATPETTASPITETDRQFKESDHNIRPLDELFTSPWRRMLESLVEGDLVPLLQAQGFAIRDTMIRSKRRLSNGEVYELDILAHSDHEVIVVEVRTILEPEDVNRFIDKLQSIKQWIPRYADHTIYGAVAWLQADAGAEEMAQRRGLLSIRATGSSAALMNPSGFSPKAW